MIISRLGGPSRRFLLDHIDRLRQSMENLGKRLRESIAEIIGKQIGEAVRDALDALLHTRPAERNTRYPPYRQHEYDPREDYPADWYSSGFAQGQDFWQEMDAQEPEEPEPQPEPEQKRHPPQWKSVLRGLAQLSAWWFQRGPKRLSLRQLLGLGTVVGMVTMAAGPVVGGVAMTVGTAVLIAGNATPEGATLPATTTQ